MKIKFPRRFLPPHKRSANEFGSDSIFPLSTPRATHSYGHVLSLPPSVRYFRFHFSFIQALDLNLSLLLIPRFKIKFLISVPIFVISLFILWFGQLVQDHFSRDISLLIWNSKRSDLHDVILYQISCLSLVFFFFLLSLLLLCVMSGLREFASRD